MKPLRQLWTSPSENAADWMLPEQALHSLRIWICCVLVGGGLSFVCIVVGLLVIPEISAVHFLIGLLGATVVVPIVAVALVVIGRLVYERSLLLFMVMKLEGDAVRRIAGLERQVEKLIGVETDSHQYICDRLADLCDAHESAKERT